MKRVAIVAAMLFLAAVAIAVYMALQLADDAASLACPPGQQITIVAIEVMVPDGTLPSGDVAYVLGSVPRTACQ